MLVASTMIIMQVFHVKKWFITTQKNIIDQINAKISFAVASVKKSVFSRWFSSTIGTNLIKNIRIIKKSNFILKLKVKIKTTTKMFP